MGLQSTHWLAEIQSRDVERCIPTQVGWKGEWIDLVKTMYKELTTDVEIVEYITFVLLFWFSEMCFWVSCFFFQ